MASLASKFDATRKPPKREHTVEEYLIKQVEAHHGKCLKFVSPGYSGVPDRIVLLCGMVIFVECKRPGKKPNKLQEVRLQKLWDMYIPAGHVASKEMVDQLIADILSDRVEKNWVHPRV